MDTVKIGKYIAAKRKERGFTQKELGDRLGVTNKTISRWENGNYMPDLSLLEPLSRELGISLNALLAGEEIKAENLTKEMLEKQTEKVLADTLYYSKQEVQKSKRKYLFAGFVGMAAILGIVLFIIMNQVYFKEVPSYFSYEDTQLWQENLPDISAYGLHISYGGKPVFRNTTAALGRAKMDYKDAIEVVKKEYGIWMPLCKYNYETYLQYAGQFLEITEDTDLKEQTEAFIRVLTIYNHSFEWQEADYTGQELIKIMQEETVDLAEQKRKALTTSFVLFVIGVVYIILVCCDIYKYKKMLKLKKQAKGEITGLLKSHLFRNDIYGEIPGGTQIGWGVAQGEQYWGGTLKWRIPPWFPCVRYEVNGKEYFRIMGEGNLKEAWRIGEEVVVVYDAENPQKSEIRGDDSFQIKIKMDVILAAIFIITGLISVLIMI